MMSMTGRDVADALDMPYRLILELLQGGAIGATKEKQRWCVSEQDFAAFRDANAAKLDRLKQEYIGLYWQGLTIAQLQKRAEQDFLGKAIVCRVAGFAKRIIYEHTLGNGMECDG